MVIAITTKGYAMEKFEDLKMPDPEMGEEEEIELEFDEEEAPEGADLAGFSDDELVKELEARGFMVEDNAEEEPVEEDMAEEEPMDEEEIV